MSIGWNQEITGGQYTAQSGILPFKISTETKPRKTAKLTYEGVSSDTPIDKVVILTTSDLEHNAVQAHLEAVGIREEINEQGTIYTCGQFRTPNCQWQVAIAQINIGNARAEAEVGRAIHKYSPSIILLVGIAEGVRDVKIGDVIAATQVYNYESSRSLEDRTVPIPKLAISPYRLEQRASAAARTGDWKQRIINPPAATDLIFKAHVRPMAAGEKEIVSDQSQIYQHIREYYADAIAVDLSGYGFLTAALAERVDGMVIRGIGNLLNRRKNNNVQTNQELAARHASAFAFEMLAKLNGTIPASKMGSPIQSVVDLRDNSPSRKVINISIKERDDDEYGISILHGRLEIVMSGKVEESLLQTLEMMKKKINSLDIIDYLDRCNERLRLDISCPIAQLLKWLSNNVDFEDENLVLAIFNSTEFIIPWELLEIQKDGSKYSAPIGSLINTVYASHFSEELNYDLHCCEGGILSYSMSTNHYLQEYCYCDCFLNLDEIISHLQDTTKQYALISIDAYSSEQIRNNPMPSIRRSNLRKQASIIVINGQLNFASENLTHQDFVKLVYTYGAKGVIASLEFVEAKIGQKIIHDFFEVLRNSRGNVDQYTPFFLRQIRKRAHQELQHNPYNDDICSSYLAAFQYIYYGNPYTILKLTPANP